MWRQACVLSSPGSTSLLLAATHSSFHKFLL